VSCYDCVLLVFMLFTRNVQQYIARQTHFYETVLTAIFKSHTSICRSFYVFITSIVALWPYFVKNLLFKYVRSHTQNKETDSVTRELTVGGGEMNIRYLMLRFGLTVQQF
jgi:hypothetical protein